MIVFDVSALVGVVIRRDSVPELAFRRALIESEVAVSESVIAELVDVLDRPRLRRFIDPDLRIEVLATLQSRGVFFAPDERVTECRDPKDDMYLELALASQAEVIVSSDSDLLVLHPCRGVRILRPAENLGATK